VLQPVTWLRGDGWEGAPGNETTVDVTAPAERLIGQPMIRPFSVLLRIGVFVALHVAVLLGVLALL
jgi:hypothetical protein